MDESQQIRIWTLEVSYKFDIHPTSRRLFRIRSQS